MNCEKVIKNIRKDFKDYVTKSGLKSVVLGISGGIDSALVASLVKPVCDEIGIKLIGLSLPTDTNKISEENRADAVGKEFCTEYKVKYINEQFNVMKKFVQDVPKGNITEREEKISYGNIKARIRMITLYHTAFVNKGMVLSTDNLTELQLSFFTINGDVGDYGAIQNLWKMEVYEISQWIVNNELKTEEKKNALQNCIDAVPTDGLGITGSDLEQLGVPSYKDVDDILKQYIEKGIGDINNPVIARHIKTAYKRNHPYNISRSDLIKE